VIWSVFYKHAWKPFLPTLPVSDETADVVVVVYVNM
jgi:hypothetical protein